MFLKEQENTEKIKGGRASFATCNSPKNENKFWLMWKTENHHICIVKREDQICDGLGLEQSWRAVTDDLFIVREEAKLWSSTTFLIGLILNSISRTKAH